MGRPTRLLAVGQATRLLVFLMGMGTGDIDSVLGNR